MVNELIENMQRLNVKSIMLDNGLGKVTLEKDHLAYDGGFRVYRYPADAFKEALNKLTANKDKLGKWQEIVTKKFTTNLIYHNDDNTECREDSLRKWSWKSDITDSGISVSEDFVIEGNINQLRKFHSYANNHMRYCNGCWYKYDNDEVTEWMKVFREFGLYEAYDSFSEYYHNSIVD